MKKSVLAVLSALSVLCITSCSTVRKTSSTQDISTVITSATEADLDVSQNKISFYYKVPKNVRRGGSNSVKATAVAEALKANGNADVLVNPQFEMRIKKGTIREITVTGYPATYKNFRKMQLPCVMDDKCAKKVRK